MTHNSPHRALLIGLVTLGACIDGPPGAANDASGTETDLGSDVTIVSDAAPEMSEVDASDGGARDMPAADASDAADLTDTGSGGPRFVEVTAGERVACALTDDGRPLCWGRNTNAGVTIPVSESEPPTWPFDQPRFDSLVGGGQRMCGVTMAGEFMCWGDNTHSAIKSTVADPWFHPPTSVDLATEQPVVDTGAGTANTCVVLGDGRGLCWGENNYAVVDIAGGGSGDLGPTQVATSVRQIAVGANNACAVTSMSRLRCWGSNSSYKSAPNSTMTNISPSAVDNANYQSVSLGVLHTCGVRSSGKVACWGSPSSVKLGVDDVSLSNTDMPVVVPGIPDATEVASGTVHTCVIADGDAWCWGNWHQNAASTPTRFESPDGKDFVSIAAGSNFSCAVSQAGTLYCWGENGGWGNVGQFAPDGTPLDGPYLEPTAVPIPDLPSGQ